MNKPRFDKNWDDFAHQIGYRDKREMLEDMYVKQGLSLTEISERLVCGTHTVNRHLQMLGIVRRTRGGNNNLFGQTSKLFKLDQRLVHRAKLDWIAAHLGISETLVYKYRKLITRQGDLKCASV